MQLHCLCTPKNDFTPRFYVKFTPSARKILSTAYCVRYVLYCTDIYTYSYILYILRYIPVSGFIQRLVCLIFNLHTRLISHPIWYIPDSYASIPDSYESFSFIGNSNRAQHPSSIALPPASIISQNHNNRLIFLTRLVCTLQVNTR